MDVFQKLQGEGLYAHINGPNSLGGGIYNALICAAAGIAVAIPAHAGYNYLVSRINKIVLEMERAAGEIVNIATENSDARTP
jgi:biopolymer transport protein ExbB